MTFDGEGTIEEGKLPPDIFGPIDKFSLLENMATTLGRVKTYTGESTPPEEKRRLLKIWGTVEKAINKLPKENYPKVSDLIADLNGQGEEHFVNIGDTLIKRSGETYKVLGIFKPNVKHALLIAQSLSLGAATWAGHNIAESHSKGKEGKELFPLPGVIYIVKRISYPLPDHSNPQE